MKRTLIKTDKNGTKYYESVVPCDRCQGRGDYWWGAIINGRPQYSGVCYKCGGSRTMVVTEKEYTPEYEQKLANQREKRLQKKQAEAMAKAAEKNAEFFAKNGFNPDGKTFYVLGNTYDIKEELKAQGAKWDNTANHWRMPVKPEGREVLELSVDEIYTADFAGVYAWNNWISANWDDPDYYVNRIKKAEEGLKAQESTSTHVGNVGDKYTATMTYIHTASWSNGYGGYWNEGVTNLHTFKDEQGNVFVWKTGKFIEADYGQKLVVSGTIKEHGDYKGIKQTVLTRCKVEEVKA